MAKKQPARSPETITTKIVPRGKWRTNPRYKELVDACVVLSYDLAVMNVFDRLSPSGGAALWRLTETSNGGFFLSPETTRRITMVSPNGYEAELSAEAAGLVATLFSVYAVSDRVKRILERDLTNLREYAEHHPEGDLIRSLLA
jgi:hypothetical protein